MSRRRNRSNKRKGSPKRSKKKLAQIRRRIKNQLLKEGKKGTQKRTPKRTPKRIRDNKPSNKSSNKPSQRLVDNTGNKKTPTRIKPQEKKGGKSSKDMAKLDDFIENKFIRDDVIKPDDKLKGKNWSPGKVEDNLAKQWQDRFTKKGSASPTRLKVSTPNTPDRLKKYTNQKGVFDTDKYVGDIRGKMIRRAKRRGLEGNIQKQLDSKGPAKPKLTKPKYGSAIENLKKKLGDVDYSKKIEETTENLTKDIKPTASGLKKIGMSILKRRSSEDGGVPTPTPKKDAKEAWKEATTRMDTTVFGKTLAEHEKTQKIQIKRSRKQGRRGVDKRLRAALQSDSPTNPQQLKGIKKFAKRKGLGKHYVEKYIKKQGTNLLQKK